MQCDIPLGNDFFVSAALLDAAIVVPVLEEEDTPVLDRLQLNEREEWLLLDRFQNEGDEVFCCIDC